MNFVKKLSTTKIFAIGFLIIIMLGTLLLSLPIASRSGQFTSFIDACFTATSSTCVTGLSVFNTYEYWSLFGQIVILCLIQIGGVGFMTLAVTATRLFRRKLSISNQLIMQESVSAPTIGGISSLTGVIVFGTLSFEFLGALAYSFFYVPKLGFLRGIFYSIFHSVSAFCNAGFDLMGYTGENSLISLQGNVYYNVVTMALIIIGGLGFFVWVDLWESKFRFNRMKLHTKMVISVSAVLLVLGSVLFFLFEMKNYGDIPLGKKILVSTFHSVSARTAGFETMDLSMMTQPSQMIMILLMMIGGSPGSTAGGYKTTTLGILFFNFTSTFKKKNDVECFGRSISPAIVKTAFTIFVMYMFLFISSAIAISVIEDLPLLTSMFETSSAIATVGLSLNVTPELGTASHLILMFLMYFGRVGPLTIFMAFSTKKFSSVSRLPEEEIKVG